MRHCTLQGHSMDILDLDWGPLTTGVSGVCNLCLASASIDNTVMVWHVPAIPAASGANGGRISRHPAKPSSSMLTPSHTLHGHTSFVKGCSFDPIGKYLATCGADNVVIMWDCATWTECSTVSEPLSNSPDRTQFRRLSWAPDGSALCLSACSKSNKPVGSVLRRPGSAGGDWLGVADLVGHNSQSTCTRFCPYLLQQQEEVVNTGDVGGTAGVENVPASAARSRRTTRASASPTSPGARGGLAQPVCCVVGMGDQDGVISIWSTHSKVPTLVIQDCFAGAVTDVSWHKSGAPYTVKEQMMCAASLDGTILLVEFHHSAQSKCEIGTEVSDITSDAHYTQLYGVTRSVLLGGLSNSSDNRHTIDGGGGNVVRGRAVVDPVLRQFLNSKTTAVVGSNSDTHQPSNGIVHTTHHNHDSSGEPSFNTVLRTGPVSTESVTSAVAGTVVIGRQDESSQDNDSGAMSAVEAEDMNAQPSAFLSQATTDQLDTRPANTEQEHRMAGKRLLSSQKTSRSGNGKRRICPVLVAVGDDATIDTLPSEVVALDSNVSGAIGGGIGAGGGSGMEMNSIRHGNGGSKGAPSTAALATSVTTTVRNSGMAFQSTQPLQHMQESLQHRMVSKRIDPISASISYRRSTATHPEATSEQFPIIPTALFTVHFEQDGLTCCSLPYQYSNLQSNSSDGDVNACKISVVVRTNVVGDRGAMDTEAGAMGLIHASPLYQLALSPLEVTKVKSSNTAACTETTGCYSSLSLIGLNGTDHLWDVVVPGCGICISGILDHNTSSTEPLDHTQDTGVCVVGCLDGSVHVYSIHQAIRLLPPMVMGSPISFIDIRSDGGGAAAGKVVYTLMVVCSNGDVCVWQLSQHLSDSVVASTALPFMSPLKCTLLYKTSVLIAMRSLKLQHAPSTSSTSPMANASPNLTHTHGKSSGQSTMNTSSSSCPMQFNVQQCSLTLENDCLITISTSIGPDSSNANKPKDKASGRHGYSGMRNAEDSGVLHTYQYSQAMHCFMCLSSVHTSLKRSGVYMICMDMCIYGVYGMCIYMYIWVCMCMHGNVCVNVYRLFSNPYTGEQKISHIAEIARHILDGAGSRDNNRHYIAAMIHLNDIEVCLCM